MNLALSILGFTLGAAIKFESQTKFCNCCNKNTQETFERAVFLPTVPPSLVDFSNDQALRLSGNGESLIAVYGRRSYEEKCAQSKSLAKKAAKEASWAFDPESGSYAYAVPYSVGIQTISVVIRDKETGKESAFEILPLIKSSKGEHEIVILRLHRGFLYVFGRWTLEVWSFLGKTPEIAASGELPLEEMKMLEVRAAQVDVAPIDILIVNASRKDSKEDGGGDGLKGKVSDILNPRYAFKLLFVRYDGDKNSITLESFTFCNEREKCIEPEGQSTTESWSLPDSMHLKRVTVNSYGKVFVLMGEDKKPTTLWVAKLQSAIGETAREKSTVSTVLTLLENFKPTSKD